MANKTVLSYSQKRNDADTVSVFSQAIESVRGTKGKALLRLNKADTAPRTGNALNVAAKSPARLAKEKEPNFK